MPNQTRLDAGSTSAPRFARAAKKWSENASRWLCATAEALRGTESDGDVIDEFVAIIEAAHDRAEIGSALVRLAHQVSGARRVELLRGELARTATPADALDITLQLSRRPGLVGDGTLRLFPAPGSPWPPRLLRRLRTLCLLAAAAEHRLAAAAAEPATVRALHDATILDAVLPYAWGQARRHHEPLSMLCISVDRLAAIDQLHGPELVDTAVRRVAETIGHMLRASDVVARLDDDRVIALLPNACTADAVRIAETVREAIAAAGAASTAMPVLTASIGVSNYPTHAHDVDTLLTAADEAMRRAQLLGRDRVATASPSSVGPVLSVAAFAG